jgi:RNAse (barnase) inhibitor barstar
MENRKWRTGEDADLAKRLMSNWNPRIQDGLQRVEKNGSGHWTVWFNHEQERKTLVLDADKFHDMEGFYNEIDELLRRNPEREIRHNLSTLHDLLRGGSRVMKFQEPIRLVWKNSRKSMRDLGLKSTNMWAMSESFFQVLTSIISEHEHIELSLE